MKRCRSTARTLVIALVLPAGVLTACSSSSKRADTFCATINALPATTNGVTDAASAKVAYKKLTDAYRLLASSAPSALKSDMTLLADLSQRSYELLAKHDFDLGKVGSDPDLASLQKDTSAAEAKAASDHLSDYAKNSCGLDLSALVPSTTAG
jgi:hypothetical protein